MLLNKMRTLGESKISVVNQGNKGGGGKLKIFLCYPRGSETSHQSFRERVGVFSARGLFSFVVVKVTTCTKYVFIYIKFQKESKMAQA